MGEILPALLVIVPVKPVKSHIREMPVSILVLDEVDAPAGVIKFTCNHRCPFVELVVIVFEVVL